MGCNIYVTSDQFYDVLIGSNIDIYYIDEANTFIIRRS